MLQMKSYLVAAEIVSSPHYVLEISTENITTELHAHDISADIVRVWLSGYIRQHYESVCFTV